MSRATQHRPNRRRRTAGERGVLLVALLMAMTVMMILLTATAQGWTAIMKREREEELLFRGNQYIIAIRAYQAEHGGQFPTDLEDLMKEGPRRHRYIRQMFKDPFSEDGEWNLLFLGPDGRSAWNPHARPRTEGTPGQSMGGVPAGRGFGSPRGGFPNAPGGVPGRPGYPGQPGGYPGQPGMPGQAGVPGSGMPGMNATGQPGVPGSIPGGGQQVGLKRAGPSRFESGALSGPIVGVVSKGQDKGFQEYYSLQYYNEWEFHVFIQQIPQVQGGNVPGLNINPQGNIGPGHGLGVGQDTGKAGNFGSDKQQGGDLLQGLGKGKSGGN